MPKPKQLWSLMMLAFGSQDAKIMPKMLIKFKQHERTDISKLGMSYPS